MTYSQFVQDVETLSRVDSGFTGISIVSDPTQPFFPTIVKEALRGLKSKKSGNDLLQAIARMSPADHRGYNILIHRVSISYDMALAGTIKPRGGRSFASGAQERLGVTSQAASIPGKGVSVIVGWCQNQVVYTPKVGPNKGTPHFVPPPVTLGHELIHGLHTLMGKSKSGNSIMVDGKQTSEEEAYTVGLGPYINENHTENKLRTDFKLPQRLSYP